MNPDDPPPAPGVKAFIQTSTVLYLAAMIDIILFVVTIGLIVLSIEEWNKTTELRYALAMIRKFMVSKDPTLKNKEDVEILYEAQNIAEDLAMWGILLKELEAEIDDIYYRLNHDWVAYRNAIYLYENIAGIQWEQTKIYCKTQNAEMLKIENEEEEMFIEKELHGKFSRYWLGIQKTSKDWRWDVDSTVVDKMYWAKKEPTLRGDATPDKPHCVRIRPNCKTPLACWESAYCDTVARTFCKLKPKKKWMT